MAGIGSGRHARDETGLKVIAYGVGLIMATVAEDCVKRNA